MNHGCLSRIGLCILLLWCVTGLTAQTDSAQTRKKNHITIGLDYLAHGEIREGGLPKPAYGSGEKEQTSARFLLNRLRLAVGYQYSSWFTTKVVLQGSGVWGSVSSLGVSLREGWVNFQAPFGLFGQVGRMPLSYDDERVLGPDDWTMGGITHDVLKIGYEGHGHQVHAILGYNQNASAADDGGTYFNPLNALPYKIMQTLWYHYETPVHLGFSLLGMNMGLQAGVETTDTTIVNNNPPKTVYQQLFGTYISYHPGFMTLEASYYHQLGKDVNDEFMVSPKVNAWMVSAKASIHYHDRYGFVLGYDHLSGDDNMIVTENGQIGANQHKEIKGFCPIYGSKHKFYGVMDYFYESVYENDFTPGLQNAYLGINGKPLKNMTCSLTAHYFATATKLENLKRSLGTDLEFEIACQINKFITISGGYTYMHGSETMKKIKRGFGQTNVHWGWLSLSVTPTLFDKKL